MILQGGFLYLCDGRATHKFMYVLRGVAHALFGVQKWCYGAKNKILQNCS
jgi:hypothetical protein